MGRRSALMRVDADESAIGCEGGTPEPEGEVQFLPQQQHQVGTAQQSRRPVESRVVDSPGTLHLERRRTAGAGEFHDRPPPKRPRHGSTGQDERTPGSGQKPQDLPRLFLPEEFSRVRLRADVHLGFYFRSQNVAGDAQMNRPRPPRSGQFQSLIQDGPRPLGSVDPPGCLGHGSGDGHLVHLLEGALPRLTQGRVSADEDQRRLGLERHVEGTDGVAVPRSRRHYGDPWSFLQPAPSIGHVHRGRLVAGVDQFQVPADGDVVEGEDLVSRQGEQMAHPVVQQAVDQVTGDSWKHAVDSFPAAGRLQSQNSKGSRAPCP